jgi:hypothetical protein
MYFNEALNDSRPSGKAQLASLRFLDVYMNLVILVNCLTTDFVVLFYATALLHGLVGSSASYVMLG